MNSQDGPDARMIPYPSKVHGKVEPSRVTMKVVNDLQKDSQEEQEEVLGSSSDRYGHEMTVTAETDNTAVPAGG